MRRSRDSDPLRKRNRTSRQRASMRAFQALALGACLCIVLAFLRTCNAQYTITAHEYAGYTHDHSKWRGLSYSSFSSSCGTVHLKSFTIRLECNRAKFGSSSTPLSAWRARRAKSLAAVPTKAMKQWILVLRHSITPTVRSTLESVLSQKLHTYLPDHSFLVWATSEGKCLCILGAKYTFLCVLH